MEFAPEKRAKQTKIGEIGLDRASRRAYNLVLEMSGDSRASRGGVS
jgi:hypothetical protein